VVASRTAGAGPHGGHHGRSIPFIAGQWSLRARRGRAPGRGARHRSIPFIAGQWSLPGAAQRAGLHWRRSIPFIAGQWSLRCNLGPERGSHPRRSIPFIAGQWSLRTRSPTRTTRTRNAQSPSLRGSGRFHGGKPKAGGVSETLNPLHCGAVVASRRRLTGTVPKHGPLNPLHCGAVVASRQAGVRGGDPRGTLNPLHCGAVVASRSAAAALHAHSDRRSIPFIAGQWSLP